MSKSIGLFRNRVAVVIALGLMTSTAQAGGWGSGGGSWGGGSWGGASNGSWNGYGSSGGAYRGGFLSHLASRHAWGGSNGGWRGGSSGGGGESHGRWGSSGGGGLFARLHARLHAHRARHWGSSGGGASSGGSYAGGGSSGGWNGGTVAGGSNGSWGNGGYGSSGYGGETVTSDVVTDGSVTDGAVISDVPATDPSATAPGTTDSGAVGTDADAPVVPDSTAPADTVPSLDPGLLTNPLDDSTSIPMNKGFLIVHVPSDARVYVNDRLTRTPGSERTYLSTGLEAGRMYRYQVRAEVVRGGNRQEMSRVATLMAGGRSELRFDFGTRAPSPVDTQLTVNVPADAVISLAGNETTVAGTHRVFRTTQLSAGETWENYQVQVTLHRDGRPVTQEKVVTLTGGDNLEVTFDFNEDKVASVR